ncbi:hypothetical protein BDW42DRAFT_173701 [Aspergillus taichungensis]|uniref:Uncharacterized protein n=1 Tax=Aspergillus taichungensis TaxID=482145 RepID=A0A2J5HPH5_9EURO|nr:hypothetical protein BDW42DRAFT_173701 [Aspergillus taichungensis]
MPPRYGQSPVRCRTCRCSDALAIPCDPISGYKFPQAIPIPERQDRHCLLFPAGNQTNTARVQRSKESGSSGINPEKLQYKLIKYVQDLHRYCPGEYHP